MGFFVPDNKIRDNMEFIIGYTEKEIKNGKGSIENAYIYLEVLKRTFKDILVENEYHAEPGFSEKQRSERRRFLRENVITANSNNVYPIV